MFHEFIEILILSIIQGISEFLPVSSSAHLILVSHFYDFKASSLLVDISLHLGSLFAILFYFRRDLLDIRNNRKFLMLMIVGSIPLIFFGYLLYTTEIIYVLRDIKIIAWSTLFFGIILYFADQRKIEKNISTNLNIKSILFIGLFQILALIPGVSRAGITLTAARFLKFNRVDSAKISFLLSVPVLLVISLYGFYNLHEIENISIKQINFIAILLSGVFSYFTIVFFLKFLKRFDLIVFVIYRIILGFVLLCFSYL